jgi:hypothetical protein
VSLANYSCFQRKCWCGPTRNLIWHSSPRSDRLPPACCFWHSTTSQWAKFEPSSFAPGRADHPVDPEALDEIDDAFFRPKDSEPKSLRTARSSPRPAFNTCRSSHVRNRVVASCGVTLWFFFQPYTASHRLNRGARSLLGALVENSCKPLRRAGCLSFLRASLLKSG